MPISRLNNRGAGIGYVIDSDEDSISWCPKCLERGNKNKLKERILLPGEKPSSDYDSWLQCWVCYKLIPTHKAKIEGEIYSDLEVQDNEFDFAKSQILGIDDTLKTRIRRGKNRKQQHPDPEIRKLISDGFELTAYSHQDVVDPRQ